MTNIGRFARASTVARSDLFYNYAMPSSATTSAIMTFCGSHAHVAAGCHGFPKLPTDPKRVRDARRIEKRGRGAIVAEMPRFLSYKQSQFVQTDVNTIEISMCRQEGFVADVA